MASIGVLGSLISQLGSAAMPQYDPLQVARQQQGLQADRTGNQTALIQLEELRRQQAAEQEVMQAIQRNPALAQQLFGGGPVLGSLGSPPPGAGGGGEPLTQQAFGPGGTGPAQVVPGGQNLSQFATQGTPQSTIGALGPQPQGAMPAPQNPLIEMAQRNPQAAFLLQKQLLGQEDLQVKRQEQRLQVGTKVLEHVGRLAQGVTDQGSLDAMRSDLISQGLGKYAAQLPQTYSKEAMAPFIATALDVKDSLMARLEARKLDVLLRGQDVELAKAQQAGGKVNYQTDAQGNIVVVPEYAPGGGPVQSRPVLGADGQPIKSLEGQKLTADQQKLVRTTESELRSQLQTRLTPFYEVRDAIGRIEKSAEAPSATGDLALITAFMKMLDPTTGVRDVEFRNAATAGGFLEQVKARLGYVQSGERLSDDMRADLLKRSRMLFEQYGKDYGQVRQQFRDLSTRLGGNPDNVDLEMGSTVAKPPGTTGSGGGQTGNTFTDADIAATLANPANKGKTRQQVIDAAVAKGLVYKER